MKKSAVSLHAFSWDFSALRESLLLPVLRCCIGHTAVSMIKDAGIPEAAVMELVGHDSKQMSAHYTHVGIEALTKAASTLPDLNQ